MRAGIVGLRRLILQNDGARERTTGPSPNSEHPGIATAGALADGFAGGRPSDDHTSSGLRVPIDHVLSAASRRGILSNVQIQALARCSSGSDAPLSWRQFAIAFPGESDPLYRLAAEIYGFRSVTVCQIGTLIYNLKLTEFLSATDWNRLFERGMVPVIEFGIYPDVVRHHLLAASDPGSRHVRSLLTHLPLSRTELVFVPGQGIQKLQALLASSVPALEMNPFIANRMAAMNRFVPTDAYSGRKAA